MEHGSAEDAVAVAGLGHMGSRLARRLLDAGFTVTVWDRDRAVAQQLVERAAHLVATPGELGQHADIVMTSLADDAALREVVLERGLLAGMQEGSVLVDLSTVSPATSREIAARAAERGVSMLDAAVSGSTAQVEAGELVVLVGGDEAVLERCRALLEPLAKAIVHMGGNGAGSTTKLAVNTILGVGMESLAEAIVLAEGAGLGRERLLDALSQTAVVAPALRPKLENLGRDEYPVAFALHLMRKDLQLVLAEAREAGLELPAAEAAARVFDAEAEAARGEEDFSGVIHELERRLAAAREHVRAS
jgi:3-hydroxyisobutyrate dehydrogenase